MRACVLTLAWVLQYCTARLPARIAHRCLSESCLAFRFKCPILPSRVTEQFTTQGKLPSPVSSGPSRTSPRPGVQHRAPCAEPQGAGSRQPRSSPRRTASRRGRTAFPKSIHPTTSLQRKKKSTESWISKEKKLFPIIFPRRPFPARPVPPRPALAAGLATGHPNS